MVQWTREPPLEGCWLRNDQGKCPEPGLPKGQQGWGWRADYRVTPILNSVHTHDSCDCGGQRNHRRPRNIWSHLQASSTGLQSSSNTRTELDRNMIQLKFLGISNSFLTIIKSKVLLLYNWLFLQNFNLKTILSPVTYQSVKLTKNLMCNRDHSDLAVKYDLYFIVSIHLSLKNSCLW